MTPPTAGRGRSVTLAAIFMALGAGLVPTAVLAHAELDAMTPADGATVDVAPSEIAATFTQDLDAARSSLVVVTASGTEVASGGEVDPAAPRQMTLALPSLEPGAYEVRWTTFSAEDGEGPERGVTTFTFTPPPPTPSPTPTPPPSATPAPTPSATASPPPSPAPSPSADGSQTGSTTDILIPIIAAVVVVAGLGYWLARRRSGAGETR
jgi:hypothetical protein